MPEFPLDWGNGFGGNRRRHCGDQIFSRQCRTFSRPWFVNRARGKKTQPSRLAFFILYGVVGDDLIFGSVIPSRSDPLTWLTRFAEQ